MADAVLTILECVGIFLGSFINGLTGFGGAIIFQTFWAVLHSWGVAGAGEPRIALAICFLIGPVQSAYLGPSALRSGEVRWEILLALLPGQMAATYLGTALLDIIDQDALKKMLGILFFAFAGWQLTVKFKAMAVKKKTEQKTFLKEIEQQEQAQRGDNAQDVPQRSGEFLAEAQTLSPSPPPMDECAWPHGGTGAHDHLQYDACSVSGAIEMTEVDSPMQATEQHEAAVADSAGHVAAQLSSSPRAYAQLAQGHSSTDDAPVAVAVVSPSARGVPVDESVQRPSGDSNSLSDALLPNGRSSSPATITSQPQSSTDHGAPAASDAVDGSGSAVAEPAPEIGPDGLPVLSVRPPSFRPGPFWRWLRPWLSRRVFHVAFVVGIISGTLQGLFGTGGPPIMMLFSYIVISKGEVRGTSIWLGVLGMLPRFLIMLSFGIFDWRADWLIYLLLPVATLVGTMGGAWLHHHVDVNAVLLVLQGLVLLSTVSLTDATSGSAFGNAMLVAYALVGCAIAAFIVFLTSMNYRFLRKRPTLAPLWAARKQRKKAVAQAAKALATQQPMVPNADGSVSTQADSH